MILCGCPTGGMAVGSGEFKVIGSAFATKHDAVKAIMVLKAEQKIRAKAIPIERNQSINVVRGAGNAELGDRVHLFTISAVPTGCKRPHCRHGTWLC